MSSTRSLLVPRFAALRAALTAEVLEAEDRIDGALVALVAGEHMAMIGPPGTAKTYLVDRLVARIGGVRFYSALMSKMMPPEDVVGQVSIPEMRVGVWRHVTDGFLPEADMALLDEFPRTSDAILNSILGLLNERRFKNGATMMACPLSTVFLCANSLPTGEAEHDLEAFWDRVVMRFEVELPKDRATWKAISRMRHTPTPDVLVSWDDVVAAKAEARALEFTDEAYDAIDEIRGGLAEIGISMSPRRCRQAQYVAAAWAWLQGAQRVEPEHCEILTNMLWEVPDQRRDVEKKVSGVVSPGYHEALELSDGVQELIVVIEAQMELPKSEPTRQAQWNETYGKSALQKQRLDEFFSTSISARARRTAEAAYRRLEAAQLAFIEVAYGVGLHEVTELAS